MKRKAQVQGMRAAMTLLALLGCLTGAKAIDVTVGDPESGFDSAGLPIYSYFNYSYSQQIYTADEIGASGTISSITLWLKGNWLMPTIPFDIYMKEVDKEVFTYREDMVQLAESDLVYSGSLRVRNYDFYTYVIELDKPFAYSGTDNLLIAINAGNTGGRSGLSGMGFKANGYRSAEDWDDNHAFDPADPPTAMSRSDYRNVITLDITSSDVARPDMLTAGDITGKGATLSWMGGSGKYNVEYKRADALAWTTAKSNTSLTSLHLYILEQNTTYLARVQSVSGTEVSAWRTTTFTTPVLYDAPADVKCTATTATTATLSWEDDGTFEAWQVCLNDDESNLYDASSSTFTLTGLIEEAAYTAKVRVVGEEGHGIWSNPVRFEPTVKTVIGAGELTSYYKPLTTESYFSISQQIYTVDELGSAAYIESIDFYNIGYQCTRNLDIYMVSTDRSSFEKGTNWETVSEGDLVFSGLVTFEENAWSTIELDKAFNYDGQRNVVLVVDDNTGKEGPYTNFRIFSTGNENQVGYDYGYTDYTPTSMSFSLDDDDVSNYKNQIRVMKVNTTLQQPQQPTVSNITFSGANVSWTGTTGTYNVAFKKEGDNTWTYIRGVDKTTFNLYGLEENAAYKVRVQAVQGNSTSLWSTAAFSTPYQYPAPSGLAYSNLTAHSVTLSWTENGTATAWQISMSDSKDYIDVTTNPCYTLEDLQEDYPITVSVRAVYGENVTSLWSDPITFEPTDKQIIGTFTESSNIMPIYLWYASLSQQIYTVAELGTAGNIMSIDFFNTDGEIPRTLDIYMVSTDKTRFESSNDEVAYTATDLVFSGEVNFLAGAWTTITLDYPFEYDGQRNVALIVESKADENTDYADFRVFDAPGQAFYRRIWSSYYTVFDWKNQIRVVKGEGSVVAKPENVTVGNITATTAKLSWAGGTGNYQVEYKKESEKTWTSITISDTSIFLYSLEQNTTYEVRVRSVGQNNTYSRWIPNAFTTLILFEAPRNLTCTAVTANTATLSWTVKDNANAWQICLNDDEDNLISANSKTYTVTGLTPEASYSAKVRSVSSEGAGQWSESVIVEPTGKHVVGSGTDYGSNLPFDSWSNYSLTQQIYTAGELGEEGTIQSIAFFNTRSECTRTLDIYMVSTDMSRFSSNSDWVKTTDADRVFSGEVTFAGNAWTTISFGDKAFEYDGESNVVLVIDDNTGDDSSAKYFRCFSASGKGLYACSDGTDFDPANPPVGKGSVSYSKNQIRLEKGDYPGTPIPQQLTVTNITPTSAKVSWKGKAEKFEVLPGIKGSWLKYDNGKVKRSSGAGGSQTWGVKFLAEDVTVNRLTKLAIYESGHNTADITVKIYSNDDKDNIPGTLLKTITMTPEGANAFHEIPLDEPLTITKGEPLWITLTTTGKFAMPSCMPNNIKEGTQWILSGGRWKELKDYHMEGYAWMIRAYMENKTVQFSTTIRTSNNYTTLRNLNPETDYVYRVRSKSGSKYSSEVSSSFTTLPLLAVPNTLAVDNITHNSADLSWTGYQEKYNVRLKTLQQLNVSAMGSFTQVGSDITTTAALTPYTFDLSAYSGTGAIAIRHYNIIDMDILAVNNIMVTDANGETVLTEDFESGQIPADWFCVDYDGDKQGWYAYQSNAGNRLAISRSWNGNALRPDNWMIIPDVPMGGSLTLYAYGLDVGYPSEVFGVYVSTAEDVVIPATTTRVNNITTNAYTFSNLKPMTTYIVQVQGVHATEGNTSWSNEETFTTGFLRGDVNASGDVTPADAIMILYNYFGVAQTGFIEKAADLNGDRSITPADAIEALYLYFGASSSSGGAGARATTPTTIDVREPE